MKLFVVLLGALIVGGVVLALIERRRGRMMLSHDLRADTAPSPHMLAEKERAIYRPGAHVGINAPNDMFLP